MTQNKAIVNKLLTNVSNQYVPEGYISELILPTISVVQTSGKLAQYGNDHLRAGEYLHSGSGKYTEVKIDNRLTKDYSLTKRGLSTIVSPEDYANVELPYDAEKDAAEHLTSLLWTEKELGLATTLTDDTKYATGNKATLSGTSQYNDLNNSTPLEDAINARKAISAEVGTSPNVAIMNQEVFEYLSIHPRILGSLGYKDNRPGMLEAGELARALKVDRILIGKANYNSAKEGQADVMSRIWGKHLIYAVAPKTASKRQISLGYRIQKNSPRRVFKYEVKDPPGATKVLVDDWYQQMISGINGSGEIIAAYLYKNAIA